MPLGSESSSVQRPFIRYAVEAGWKYLSPDEALNRRQGGVTSPVLDAVLLGQLAKLNPGIVNTARAQDIVRRLVRVRPTIEGNLDAWEFLKGLKTVFVDTEKRERNVQLLDPVNVDANQFHVTDEFTFSNGTPPDIRLDLVFSINGVPVLPVETTKATAMDGIAQALDDLRYYHKKGPELLALSQLHALTHLIANQKQSDTVKVFNLLKALANLVNAKAGGEPYLISIGDRAQEIAEAFESRQMTTQQALELLEKLIAELKGAEKDRDATGLSPEAFAVFYMLKTDGVADPLKAAQAVEAAFQQYPHWQTSEPGAGRAALDLQSAD